MGMYTGLRCKLIVKPEFRREIQRLLEGVSWKDLDHLIFKEFGTAFARSRFIPYGTLSYMPKCWEKDTPEVASDGFESRYYPKTGLWTFQCSLKNYDDEIGFFIQEIVPLIAERVIHLEDLYEEFESSNLYQWDEARQTWNIVPLQYEESQLLDIPGFDDYGVQEEESSGGYRYETYDFSGEEPYRQGEYIKF